MECSFLAVGAVLLNLDTRGLDMSTRLARSLTTKCMLKRGSAETGALHANTIISQDQNLYVIEMYITYVYTVIPQLLLRLM